MKILSIETSCDETAVSIVEANGELESPTFTVLGNSLLSQIELHREFGGVYPNLAKREHAKNLPPLLEKTLTDAGMYKKRKESSEPISEAVWEEIEKMLVRENGLYGELKTILEDTERPHIDAIAVTYGPGLEPALWVGISCALALSKLWDIPVVPVNHMEGHIVSVLIENTDKRKVNFPSLALLISGGHTELVEITNWGQYKILGKTLDDAVGEAFDKAARMMDLPYPGGPQISRLAEEARDKKMPPKARFTRPMIHSHNLNFSFSGLKTAVLYYIRDTFGGKAENLSLENKSDIAREFEDTVVDVLLAKTKEALDETGAKTLIIAGGVIANKKLREEFGKLEKEYSDLSVKVPTNLLSTDNALMIASAAYINIKNNPRILTSRPNIVAKGNLQLS